MRRRLFVAAELDDAARAACARVAERLRATGWTGRFAAPETYHLTLAFLGSVEGDERVDAVRAALREIAPSVPQFALALDAVGGFPDRRRPRVAWVGPERPDPNFGTLCGVVRSALVAHGFSFDPHADAHVTLARADGTSSLPPVAPPGITVAVETIALFESHTGPAGARYEALERLALAEPGTILP